MSTRSGETTKSNISYRRSRVAEIIHGPDDCPVLVYEDTQEQVVRRETFDLVILATACAPSDGIDRTGGYSWY